MTDASPASRPLPAADRPAWGAVVAMALGVFGLVTAEFLPASLLTPMAADLGVTEGAAGQAVTATAVVALVTSLVIAAAIRRLDRRLVLIGFSILLIASDILVALAPDLTTLLFGRVLLGIAIGGFWTMSAAIVMRLVPQHEVPRALSMIFTGVSAATILAAPVGSYLGNVAGWRIVFFLAAGLGLVALVTQLVTLPRLAPAGATHMRTLVEVLLRPGIGIGMVAVLLVFAGHFAGFTYIRPFLETVTGISASVVPAFLLGFGIANFLGTLASGPMLEKSLRLSMLAMPFVMALLALGLVTVGSLPAAAAVMIGLWGFAFGAVPVAWSTWLTRTVPDQAESAGGLLVAAIQFAIALGAAAGGLVFDRSGAPGVFAGASAVLILATLLILLSLRSRAAAPRTA